MSFMRVCVPSLRVDHITSTSPSFSRGSFSIMSKDAAALCRGGPMKARSVWPAGKPVLNANQLMELVCCGDKIRSMSSHTPRKKSSHAHLLKCRSVKACCSVHLIFLYDKTCGNQCHVIIRNLFAYHITFCRLPALQ